MSLGMAVICNRGENIICVTDGLVATELCVDVSTFKMQFFMNWVFMFAGTLSNADLIMEELRKAVELDENALSRKNIQSSLRKAYIKRRSEWVADRLLAPYDLTVEEFQSEGLKMFGEKLFGELDSSIRQDSSNFNEYIMVAGWGDGDFPMIYALTPDGSTSAAYDGFEAIGCGASIANNTLLLLKCARHLPFEYALYAATAAKFAAEGCQGVGRSTVIAVTHKPKPKEEKWFTLIQPEQEDKIRKEWEKHSRPKIPGEALPAICIIANDVMGHVSDHPPLRAIVESLKLAGVNLKL